jgi:hypothetical protein
MSKATSGAVSAPIPDIALMSFVKWFEREISSPCDFRRSAVVMIVQRWRRSLKTSVIKL